MTEDIINDVLKRDKLFNETKPTKGSKKKNAYDLELQKALDSARRLWGTEQRDDNSTCKDGTIEFVEKASAETKGNERRNGLRRKQKGNGDPSVSSEGNRLTKEKADKWVTDLQKDTQLKPSTEQHAVIEAIKNRVIDENSDIVSGKEFRSEPLQLLLHGVPGAGKSQTLKWIRKFFEEVCNFKHERDFVFVASQNTMAALIEGVTLHSYGDVPYYGGDGKRRNARKKKQTA